MARDARPDFRMASMSSMIVELPNTISSRDENIQRLPYQSTLFPQPATKWEIHQRLRQSKRWTATDVSHGPIGGNSALTFAIPKGCRLERTTPLSRCAAIRGRCYNFSMDRAERANDEYLFATCHLPDHFSVSRQQCQRLESLTFRLIHVARHFM